MFISIENVFQFDDCEVIKYMILFDQEFPCMESSFESYCVSRRYDSRKRNTESILLIRFVFYVEYDELR